MRIEKENSLSAVTELHRKLLDKFEILLWYFA